MASSESRLRRRPPDSSADEEAVDVIECDGPRKRLRLEGGSAARIPLLRQARHTVPNQSLKGHYSSVVEVFDEHARIRSTGHAVVQTNAPNECMTWLQLKELSVRIAVGLNDALRDLRDTQGTKRIVATLLRRSDKWIAATVAVLRCGLPFVWLSAGEAAITVSKASSAVQSKWWVRNAAILRLVEPICIIANGAEAPPEALPRQAAVSVVQLSNLLRQHAQDAIEQLLHAPVNFQQVCPADLLCYMFTGGSTGSPKCVRIPHAMALHEVRRYPDIVTLTPEDRILQHTSVFWAASAWGQIDIALAFGSALCVSLSPTLSARELCAAGITVLGVSPSQLASILPAECPSISCIFSWGEALPPALAARWRSVPRLRLIELLISTEYWLSFFCDEAPRLGGPVTFKAVEGTDFAVLPQSNFATSKKLVATVGAVGELCIRGPAVTHGYLDGTAGYNSDSFIDTEEGSFYHTKDAVCLVIGRSNRVAIEFRGRSDSMIKVGAEFVNLGDVECRLEELSRGRFEVKACVLPPSCQGKGPHAHAFITAAECISQAEAASFLREARAILPHGTSLHFLSNLPKNSITGKIDRQCLKEYAAKQLGRTEPLAREERAAIMWRLIRRYPIWWPLLGLVCCLDTVLCTLSLTRFDSTCCSYMNLTLLAFGRAIFFPFVWLATVFLVPAKNGTDLLPFGRLGLALTVMTWGGFSSNCRIVDGLFGKVLAVLCRFASFSWFSLCVVGSLAAWRSGSWRRLVTWPVTFWIAMPHRAQEEILWWVSREAWRWWLHDVFPRLPCRLSNALQELQEAPQFEFARWLSFGILRPRETEKAMPTYNVGSSVQKWSVCKQKWLDAKVISARANSVTVKYAWSDGQVFQQELYLDSDRLRPMPSGLLTSMFRVVGLVATVVSSLISHCRIHSNRFMSIITRVFQCSNRSMQGIRFSTIESEVIAENEAHLEEEWTAEDSINAAYVDTRRQEAKYQGYLLTEWLLFEGRWWKECLFDFINYVPGKIPIPESVATPPDIHSNIPAVKLESGASSFVGQTEAKVIKLVEKHLQLFAINTESHLAGASSLSFMALCRALRVDLGCELQPDMAMRCETVGQLLRLAMEQRHVEPPMCLEETSHATDKYAIYFAPSQVKGTCAWIYQTDRALQPALFLEAARRLIERHEALRYTLLDPPELLPFIQVPASIHVALNAFLSDSPWCQPWPWCRNVFIIIRAVLRSLQRLLSFALKAAWPLVGPEPSLPRMGGASYCTTKDGAQLNAEPPSSFHQEVARVVTVSSWKEVIERARTHKRDFVPPFSITLYLLNQSDAGSDVGRTNCDAQSFIHIICTHAFSDGFTSFPLISDFSEIYEELTCLSSACEVAGHKGSMPRTPSAFATLQGRLFDALELQPPDAAPEQSTLRPTEFYLPDPHGVAQPGSYNHQLMFESGAISALRSCSSAYSVPLDVMLLGIVVGALFRTGVSDATGRLTGSARPGSLAAAAQLLTLALYAPMRDSVANEAMVGLFSDWRELTVGAAAASPTDSDGNGNWNSATVLGLTLQLTGQIRAREWRMFSALQNSERILVNILALDERSHGHLQLRQTRRHEYSLEHFMKQRERVWRQRVLRPMRLTLEQYEPTSWWLSIDLSDKPFPPAWCRAFVCNLHRTMHDLIERPLTALL